LLFIGGENDLTIKTVTEIKALQASKTITVFAQTLNFVVPGNEKAQWRII